MENINDIQIKNEDQLFDILEEIDSESITESDESLDRTYNYCEECKCDNYIVEDTTNGILVCKNCGTIIQSLLDKSPEWKQYGNDGERGINRCSMPINTLLPQSSLGTTIASKSPYCRIRDINGWQKMPYRERSLCYIFNDIQDKCQKAKIYKCIVEDAKYLYKKISESKHKYGKKKGKKIIIRGTNKDSLVAACVYYACKKKKQTRSQKEIAKIFSLKNTDITRGCKTFMKLLKNRDIDYDLTYSMPENFIQRHCKKLHIKNKYIDQAIKIVKNIQKLNIATEHTPLSVASGSILLVTIINKLSLTKKKIASEFAVSEVTISKVFKKLEPYKDILIDDKLTEKVINVINIKKDFKRHKVTS